MSFEEFLEEWNSEKPFIEAKTSGSTGTPKEIVLDKDFVRRSAERTISFFGINKGSHLYSCISADSIGGKMMAVRSQLAGCKFSWESPSNEPLQALKEKVDLVSVVPSQMFYLIDRHETLDLIRTFLIGGSSIHNELRKKIIDAGISAWESYGMTETASHIALRKVSLEDEPFKAFDDIDLRLDKRGCLVIRYADGEEIHTNDFAQLLSEKEFRITGRIDDVIISGGKKINPYEVERKIRHLLSSEFIIVGEPDEKWGTKVVLKIENEESLPDNEWIIKEVKKILEPYEIPKEIKRVKRLERNAGGKIVRNCAKK